MDEPSGWSYFKDAAHPAACLDDQLRYRCVNDAWEAGACVPDMPSEPPSPARIGASYLDELDAATRDHWARALREIVGGRLGHVAEEVIASTPGGERRLVRTASPTFGADARPDGVLLVCYDVTGADLAARNAEQHALMLRTARRLQHFLGNQLALTMGYVELLTIDPHLPDELRARVDEALRGVVGATETLTYLRQLARQEIAPDDPSVQEYLGGEHG